MCSEVRAVSPGHALETAAQTAARAAAAGTPGRRAASGARLPATPQCPPPRGLSPPAATGPRLLLVAFCCALGASLGPGDALALPTARAAWVLPPTGTRGRPSVVGSERGPGARSSGRGQASRAAACRPADGSPGTRVPSRAGRARHPLCAFPGRGQNPGAGRGRGTPRARAPDSRRLFAAGARAAHGGELRAALPLPAAPVLRGVHEGTGPAGAGDRRPRRP